MNKLVEKLKEFIRESYLPEEKISVSKSGIETIFFKKSGKPLCYISTENEKSIVTVVIGVKLVDKVNSLNLSDKAKKMFKNAKQYHDGKWLHFEILTEQDLDDIKKLLVAKRRP